MPSKRKMARQGGELQTCFGSLFCDQNKPVPWHRQAALALLFLQPELLSRKEAGFLGQVCIASEPSEKQRAWLVALLGRCQLPQLAKGWGQ